MFIAALFTITKTWKQSKCASTDEWIKVSYIHTIDYYSAIKKNEIMPCTACNAGVPGSIPGSGRPSGKNILPIPVFLGLPGGSDGEESTCNAGNLGSIPGLGRSSGGGHGNPPQYSRLENPHG